MDLFEVSMEMLFEWSLHNDHMETVKGSPIPPAETWWRRRYVLSLSLSYVSVCLPFPLYLCLLLPLFLFVRVTDILLTVEQGRGLPRTYRIYGCARGHPTECVDREVPPYIYGGGLIHETPR